MKTAGNVEKELKYAKTKYQDVLGKSSKWNSTEIEKYYALAGRERVPITFRGWRGAEIDLLTN